MKRIITTIAALAISAVFVQAADAPAAAKKPEGEKKKADPEAAWAKVSDGKESLTKDEFTAKAKDKDKAGAQFNRKDANKDGKLTKEEFTAVGKKKENK